MYTTATRPEEYVALVCLTLGAAGLLAVLLDVWKGRYS